MILYTDMIIGLNSQFFQSTFFFIFSTFFSTLNLQLNNFQMYFRTVFSKTLTALVQIIYLNIRRFKMQRLPAEITPSVP